MGQSHVIQHGVFHVTTNAYQHIPWCTKDGVPQILINHLFEAKRSCVANLYAFCVLPDHIHMIVNPGENGLSKFVQLFKKCSTRHINGFLQSKDPSGDPQIADTQIADRRVDGQSSVMMHSVRWQKGFFAREICNDRQWDATMAYIRTNPVRHRLVETIDHWPWTSERFVDQMDQRASSLLGGP